MGKLFAAALIGLAMVATAATAAAPTAWDFKFDSIDGAALPMASFKGKAVLVVNTASQCGFTPQYDGLEKLYETYRARGLMVLGVPSNDFGGQEPGSAAEIKQFCESTFNVQFPLTAKYDVIGPQAHPFYRWAAQVLGAGSVPNWNFHKYLVDPQGRLVASFTTETEPMSAPVTKAIEAVLGR